MTEKRTTDEDYLNHSFDDMYRFAKESENKILIDYVNAVKDSIITSSQNQHINIPVDASLKICEIFDGIPKNHPDRQYFSDWKDELILYLGRLKAANKSQIKFVIWECRMNVLKTIEKMALAEDKMSTSYKVAQHESQNQQ